VAGRFLGHANIEGLAQTLSAAGSASLNAAVSSCDGSVAKIPLQRVLANDKIGQQAAADFPNSFRNEKVQAQVSKAIEEKAEKPSEKQDASKRERSPASRQTGSKESSEVSLSIQAGEVSFEVEETWQIALQIQKKVSLQISIEKGQKVTL